MMCVCAIRPSAYRTCFEFDLSSQRISRAVRAGIAMACAASGAKFCTLSPFWWVSCAKSSIFPSKTGRKRVKCFLSSHHYWSCSCQRAGRIASSMRAETAQIIPHIEPPSDGFMFERLGAGNPRRDLSGGLRDDLSVSVEGPEKSGQRSDRLLPSAGVRFDTPGETSSRNASGLPHECKLYKAKGRLGLPGKGIRTPWFQGSTHANRPESNKSASQGIAVVNSIDFGSGLWIRMQGKQQVVTASALSKLPQRYFRDPNRAL